MSILQYALKAHCLLYRLVRNPTARVAGCCLLRMSYTKHRRKALDDLKRMLKGYRLCRNRVG